MMYRNPPERKGRRCHLRPSTWNTCATGTHLRSSAPGIQAARGGRGEGWPEERLKESSLVNSFPAWNSSSQGQATEPRRATNAAMRSAGRSASTTDSAARTAPRAQGEATSSADALRRLSPVREGRSGWARQGPLSGAAAPAWMRRGRGIAESRALLGFPGAQLPGEGRAGRREPAL